MRAQRSSDANTSAAASAGDVTRAAAMLGGVVGDVDAVGVGVADGAAEGGGKVGGWALGREDADGPVQAIAPMASRRGSAKAAIRDVFMAAPTARVRLRFPR
jgi:hypothetical protein